MLIVLTTIADQAAGEALAVKIVEAKLAACVQIMPQMTSVYIWERRLQKEGEHMLLIKTLPEKYGELEAFITANHSYDVPEIVAIDAANVSDPYLSWMKGVLAGE
ncbi:MAG: divalent-cation tolerance protein CutA [Acidobacteriota bacterium]